MTGEDGVAVATYEYDPYGRPLLTWTQDPIGERNPLRYRAYYADAETGMFYLPARYYDPATYRFLSPDPAPPSAGDPLSLNAFVYCLGDPVGLDDPSGADPPGKGVNKVGSREWSQWRRHLRRTWSRVRFAAWTGRVLKDVVDAGRWVIDSLLVGASVLGGAVSVLGDAGGMLPVAEKTANVNESLDHRDEFAEELVHRAVFEADDDVAYHICVEAIESGYADPPMVESELRTGYTSGRYAHTDVIGWAKKTPEFLVTERLWYFNPEED